MTHTESLRKVASNSEERPTPWWKTATFYQIYPRSFADTNGDGIGDLEGVRRRLDYLQWLGIDAIWLSPFYPSPMADFGYDVADHCSVDPIFGNLEDFDRLIADAHERGMRVVVDWIPNHTSDRHEWFVDSRSSRASSRRDWYVWADPRPDGDAPNNWRAAFSATPGAMNSFDLVRSSEARPGSPEGRDPRVWTLDASTGQFYLHLFLSEQPDLNWRNPEVVEAMHNVLRFWLDRGVDGFRADALHCIVKDVGDFHESGGLAETPRSDTNYSADIHPILRGIRELLDSYAGDRMMVGEVNLLDAHRVASFYGAEDQLHLAFNFLPLHTGWDALLWRKQIEHALAVFEPIGAWPTWVLSNHDNPRHRTRYGGSIRRARAVAVMMLTLRGSPFLFAGEELGLEDAVIPAELQVDPGGRDGCRVPIPWLVDEPHGWEGSTPWLPWPPEPSARSVEAQRDQPNSTVHLYRRILELRRNVPELQLGELRLVDSPAGTVAYDRLSTRAQWRVLINFTTDPVEIPEAVAGVVCLTSDTLDEGTAFSGVLAGEQAVVLRMPLGERASKGDGAS